MTLNRRAFLSSTALAGPALFATGARAAPADALKSLFDALYLEDLRSHPRQATLLGMDKGANAGLKVRLDDNSPAGIAAQKAQTTDQLARLKAIDASGLSGADRINYDTVVYTKQSQARLQAFDFGGPGGVGPSPYVISQQSGAYVTVPDFLDTKHTIETATDADAYLARLEAFAGQLDNDTERMKHDTAQGVVPPDFLLDLTLGQLGKIRVPAAQSVMVTSLSGRAKSKGLSGDYGAKAAALFTGKVAPALDRQFAAVTRLRATAGHDSSLKGTKDGAAYYAASLQSYTTTNLTPQQVHQLGLDQGKEIGGRLDAELKKQGLTKGTIGARLSALAADPRHLYPNTDAGKAEIIAFCNARLADVRPKLPSAFKRLPPYAFEVRREPVATEAGAAAAHSQAPAIDGSRPGIVYFSLRDTAEWPRFELASTVFHEGLPGHQLEGGLALSDPNMPLLRKTISFSGYAEGWGLYAEQLADELGMHEAEPLGRIGYLKWMLFRAQRCVVDTGLFHYGWSREKAIQSFVDVCGDPPSSAAREVERYCALPGQACSYKLGHTVWARGRDRAVKALGARYDIKDFHEAGLSCGRVPLDILDSVIDRYIKAKTV
jgi:uncharacterized protein (DUF885 family)